MVDLKMLQIAICMVDVVPFVSRARERTKLTPNILRSVR